MLYMCCWAMFPIDDRARWFAAAVPAVMTLQFGAVGLGVLTDQQLVHSVSVRPAASLPSTIPTNGSTALLHAAAEPPRFPCADGDNVLTLLLPRGTGPQRQGHRSELLLGPLQYGVVHVLATLVFWRDSAPGVLALSALCAGDGAAEMIGRRFGTRESSRGACCTPFCSPAERIRTPLLPFLPRPGVV